MIIKTYEEHDGTIIVTMENKENEKFVLHIYHPPYANSDVHKNTAYYYAENLANFMGCSYIKVPVGMDNGEYIVHNNEEADRKLYLIVADGAYGISFDVVCLAEPCDKNSAYKVLTKDWTERERECQRCAYVVTELKKDVLGIIHTEAPTGG